MAHTLNESPNAKLNKSIFTKYVHLEIPEGICLVEYVWIDWKGLGLRSKAKTLDFIPKNVEDCPVWIIDGPTLSFKIEGEDSDTYLTPVSMYRDPFRLGNNKIVLCANYKRNKVPMDSNKRHNCNEAMEAVKHLQPWFGIEQEYTFLDVDNRPLGWPKNGFPASLDSSYLYLCGVGAGRVIGREIVESHYKACLYAGIKVSGINAEAAYGQWEFQVGPTEGIKVADDLWMARYLLNRIAEEYGVVVTYDPKPVVGNWNGCGAHCNFSTNEMRVDGGIDVIKKACEKLSKCHMLHMKVYDSKDGTDNARRLNGQGATSLIEHFSYGIGDRRCSVRIPRVVANEGKGYLEDRRPAADCDPYLVTERIVRTVCLDQY